MSTVIKSEVVKMTRAIGNGLMVALSLTNIGGLVIKKKKLTDNHVPIHFVIVMYGSSDDA